jgi:hypothetical protein
MSREEFETACAFELNQLEATALVLLRGAEEIRFAKAPDPAALGQRL